MFGWVLTAILLGLLAFYAVALTFEWLRDTISHYFVQKTVVKVIVADIHKMAEECDDKMSAAELNRYAHDGYSKVFCGMDQNGNIVDNVAIVKDSNPRPDKEVEELLGNEGMVIVDRD
ncbi:MAG: hypothetical protein HUJ60_01780 [Bacilli bacterium]|nr:hypothetical protein [Bacilli bacterium]